MMLKLVVLPDGRAILTSPEQPTERMVASIREAWQAWLDGKDKLLFLPECDVVQVLDVDLDLPEEATR